MCLHWLLNLVSRATIQSITAVGFIHSSRESLSLTLYILAAVYIYSADREMPLVNLPSALFGSPLSAAAAAFSTAPIYIFYFPLPS